MWLDTSVCVCVWFQIAARTLGDLVRKLGEKILPEIIPILEESLRSDKSDERQGVCIGLSEIMKSTSKDAVSDPNTGSIHPNHTLNMSRGCVMRCLCSRCWCSPSPWFPR